MRDIMEMTFYDDSENRAGRSGLKRPVTLDLKSPDDSASKKQKIASILTSPDLNMLKLASPELERFIIANGSLTMTPTPTQYLFPKNVTEEQEQYARGFIDALNQLHQVSASGLIKRIPTPVSNPSDLSKLYTNGVLPFYVQPAPASATTSVIKSSISKTTIRPPSVADTTSSNSCNSISSSSMPVDSAVKEELQTVPSDFSSPPVSPLPKQIDMKDQERIKLERKRQRNRVAASKCRRRKLERISELEDKVKDLKGENTKLELVAERLREQVCSLKQRVMDHVKKGCQIMVAHDL